MAAKEKKGLGTGLAALFGDDDFEESSSELLTLPISKVEPRKEQPREYFDEAALQELAESLTGKPAPIETTDRVVCIVEYRDGSVIDVIRQIKPFTFED